MRAVLRQRVFKRPALKLVFLTSMSLNAIYSCKAIEEKTHGFLDNSLFHSCLSKYFDNRNG